MTAENVSEHREAAPDQIRFAIVTVSDTRTQATDKSGQLLEERLTAAGHLLHQRSIVPDEPSQIAALLLKLREVRELDAVILTGGTGIAPRDRTPEAVAPLLDMQLPGFGELFRMLSYEEIGAAAMLSRALAGRLDHLLVFCLPGSTAACRLAADRLLVPELSHLVHHCRPATEKGN